jgi:hypothetical protein
MSCRLAKLCPEFTARTIIASLFRIASPMEDSTSQDSASSFQRCRLPSFQRICYARGYLCACIPPPLIHHIHQKLLRAV